MTKSRQTPEDFVFKLQQLEVLLEQEYSALKKSYRSDNGPEFIAQKVRGRIATVGAKTAYIEPGSPWENGYCESFNARFRYELLNGEIFYSLREAQILIEKWRIHYNTAGHTAHWATAHPRQKASCRWTTGLQGTNN